MTHHEHAATPTPGWRAFWRRGGWWKALLFVAGYLVIYEAAGWLLTSLFMGDGDGGKPLASAQSVLVAIAAPLAVGAIVLLAFLRSARWPASTFTRQPINGRWWMWCAVGLARIPILLRLFGIDYGAFSPGVVPAMFLAGLLVGFTEELVYRGIVVKLLRNAGHREVTVAVLSSLLFALSHSINAITGQPVATVAVTVVYTFGFGILMYLALRVTGSLVWPILLHALTDPTTILATGGIDENTLGTDNVFLSIAGPFSYVFVLAGLLALFFIRGRVTHADNPTGNSANHLQGS